MSSEASLSLLTTIYCGLGLRGEGDQMESCSHHFLGWDEEDPHAWGASEGPFKWTIPRACLCS